MGEEATIVELSQLEELEINKAVKELQLAKLMVPGFNDFPIGELMAVPFGDGTNELVTTTAEPDQQQNQQLSGRQAFLWTHFSMIATDQDVSWVLEDSFYQNRFTFDASQIQMKTWSGLGDDGDNKTPSKLPCAVYFPSNTSLTMFVTDLSPTANNPIFVTLLGMKVRMNSPFHDTMMRRMAYIGMGSGTNIIENL